MRQAYGRYRGNSLARKSYGDAGHILGAARSATANQSPTCPGLWIANVEPSLEIHLHVDRRSSRQHPIWGVGPRLRGQREAHTMTAQDRRTGPEVSTAPWV